MYTYEDFLSEWQSDADTILCHTSGSTGKPSEILLPKKEVAKSARRTVEFFGIDSESMLYSCISPEFIGGKMQMVRALEAGCRFAYEKPSNRPLENCREKVISLLSVVPSQMIHILENPERMPELKAILVGGSPIPVALRDRIARSGLNVWETYGMTETASHIALRRVNSNEEYFTPLSGITIGVDGDGKTGKLRIRIGGWKEILTNDIAEIDADGRFRILGRTDNVIISGGRKIHPEELESRLSRVLDFPFYLSSEPDEKWGRRLILVAECIARDNLGQHIIDLCRPLCEAYEVPKAVRFVERLPRTANGKIARNSEGPAR